MPTRNPNTAGLVDKSLQISVVKKNVYDTCLKLLKMRRLPVRSRVLTEKINEIPIREFKRILAVKESEEQYNKSVTRLVKLAIKKYGSFLKTRKEM